MKREWNLDALSKAFLADNDRYADLINGFGCGGKQVVTANDLQELDSQTGLWKFPIIRSLSWKHRRIKLRDLVRRTALGVNFAVVGIESQETIDYSLVVRCMSYHAGEYERQLAQIRKIVRRNPEELTPGEYLYGFRKVSRLRPSVIFVIYWGEEIWDGAENLHEILDFTDFPPELKALVPDHTIHVIDVRRLKDTSMFHTDLRQVFDFIRFAEDKQKLKEYITPSNGYQDLAEDAFDMMAAHAGYEELIQMKALHQKKDRRIDMCEGLRGMLEDSRQEGFQSGKLEGFQSGKLEGFDLGRQDMILGILREYGAVPEELERRIREETDTQTLMAWNRLAVTAGSIEKFREGLRQIGKI